MFFKSSIFHWNSSGDQLKLTKLVEVGFHFICRRLLTDSPHKNLFGFIRLALGLGRGVLGVDLLAVEAVRGDGQHPVHGVGVGEGDEAEAAAPLQ